ncbi:MAG: SDR family oxidoreductase [Verrucomicrobiota bacterium]
MRRVLLAGSTGYLGKYIAQELHKRAIFFKVVVRSLSRLKEAGIESNEELEAELTDPNAVIYCCRDMDVVISTVGITKQKDGLSYMDVDYQANMNLLNEALKSGVKKFIYVSVLNGKTLRHLKMCNAKERFVEQLKKSGIDYCIIRPNGYFSDMSEFLNMAQKGRVYLFGDGEQKINPIHGEDLAQACIDAIEESAKEVEIGGPQTLTHNELASIAFDVSGNQPRIAYIPHWLRLVALKLIRWFTKSAFSGPVEFFMTVMAMDMLAPEYGKRTLKEYFASLGDANG